MIQANKFWQEIDFMNKYSIVHVFDENGHVMPATSIEYSKEDNWVQIEHVNGEEPLNISNVSVFMNDPAIPADATILVQDEQGGAMFPLEQIVVNEDDNILLVS